MSRLVFPSDVKIVEKLREAEHRCRTGSDGKLLEDARELLRSHSIRRTASNVLSLPRKTSRVIEAQMEPAQEVFYRIACKSLNINVSNRMVSQDSEAQIIS